MLRRFPVRLKSSATTTIVTQFPFRQGRALGQFAEEVRRDAVDIEPSGGPRRVPLRMLLKRKGLGACVDCAIEFPEDGAHPGCTARGARRSSSGRFNAGACVVFPNARNPPTLSALPEHPDARWRSAHSPLASSEGPAIALAQVGVLNSHQALGFP